MAVMKEQIGKRKYTEVFKQLLHREIKLKTGSKEELELSKMPKALVITENRTATLLK